jgi:hypothetical protein
VAHGRALVETVDGLRAASISAILSLKFPPIEKKEHKTQATANANRPLSLSFESGFLKTRQGAFFLLCSVQFTMDNSEDNAVRTFFEIYKLRNRIR